MSVDVRDVHQTLEYRLATAMARLLPTGLLLIFLSLVILVLVDFEREPWTLIGIVLCFITGFGLVGFSLWRRMRHGKPLFTLSPAGIRFRIVGVKEFLIPWREIKSVDTIDVEAGIWSMMWSTHTLAYRTFTIDGVTAILVTEQFYKSRIHVDSFLLRGPGWDANFIPKGPMVQVALHHEAVSTDPRELREAVEARWLAFRDQPEPVRSSVPRVTDKPAADATPAAKPIAMGEDPRSIPRWEALKIAALLVGIAAASANLAGLWNLPGQAEDRIKHAKAYEDRKQREETSRRIKEEWKKRDEAEAERRRQFDETMRRAFSR